jgi:hypothetical protein
VLKLIPTFEETLKLKIMEIKGVKIGDKFIKGKHQQCVVVDFYTVTNLAGRVVRIECIAVQTNGFCSSPFEVAFTTVIRGRC